MVKAMKKMIDLISIIALIGIAVYYVSKIPREKKIVKTNIFDKEETFEDCTVQVLTNTVTGETSVGWWRNNNPPEEEDV